MVRAANEKMLGANLPSDYVEEFWQKAAPEGTSKNLIIKAMSTLWLDMPDDVRTNYLYPGKGQTLKQMIENIVDSRIEAFYAAQLEADTRLAMQGDVAAIKRQIERKVNLVAEKIKKASIPDETKAELLNLLSDRQFQQSGRRVQKVRPNNSSKVG